MNIDRLLGQGRSDIWIALLRDWDRFLRAGNHPETTRSNYLLAARQLADYLAEEMPGSGGARDPAVVVRREIVAFQAWMVETRSASTGLNKHKSLQQFFRWLVEEGEIDRSPMAGVHQPRTKQKLQVLTDEQTRRIREACRGTGFLQVRDQALVRMYYNTGGRLSEVAGLLVSDLDLDTDSVILNGKGGGQRRARFGAETQRALLRYVRQRNRRPGAVDIENLWIAARGVKPLRSNGVKIRLKRLGEMAGIENVTAQRWRHSFANEWKRAGGDSGDLMLLMGWHSEDMVRRYGASAAAERAQETHARLGVGERV